MSRARLPSRGRLAALAVALAVMGAAGTAHAQITFDPDGPGGANGDRTILSLDYLPGNVVAIDAVPLTPASVGTTFTNLFQAKLGATVGDSSPIPGLNSTFEITVVARFVDRVDAIIPIGPTTAQALFSAAADQSTSFLEIYYDDFTSGVQSNDLTGVGFADGQLILSGQILPDTVPGTQNFTAQFSQIVLFDQAGGDDHSGQMTVSGSGGSQISTSVGFVDTGFFKTPGLQIIRTAFNTSLVDPFREVNPSRAFLVGDPRTYDPVLGTVNGQDGPDFQFQGDATQSFVTAVIPEPGSMILAVTGLATVSLGSLRKLRRRSGTPAA